MIGSVYLVCDKQIREKYITYYRAMKFWVDERIQRYGFAEGH